MKKARLLAAVAIMAATLVSCSKSKTPQQFDRNATLEEVGVKPEKVAALDALLESYVADKRVNCVTAFVAKQGKIVYEKSFGYKNLETMTPAKTDDIYVLFSQTKAIVAVALMTLYEQGLLDVEDPISKWIPNFSNVVLTGYNEETGEWTTEPAERPVKVADLMSHSSGYLAPLTNRYIRAKAAEGVDTRAPRTTVKENVEFNTQFPLGFQPGSNWNYNYDMEVIAYLVEIISGKPLPQYLQETIFDPLGMDSTGYFFDDESLRPRIVTTYSNRNGELVPGGMSNPDAIFNGPKTYAGGTLGLYGSIEDYARFCQMLINGGEFNNHRILKPETILLMRQNRLPEVNSNGKGFQFGLGFELFGGDPAKKNDPRMSSQSFRWGGAAGTEYMMDPENELVFLYYISMSGGAKDTYSPYVSAVYDLFEE